MPNTGFPSIGDLLSSSKKTGKKGDPAQEEFKLRMGQIDVKEREESTKKEADLIGVPYINLSEFPVPVEALKTLPEAEAREHKLVCFYYSGADVRVGITEKGSLNDPFINEFAERVRATVKVYLISTHSFENVLKLYSSLPIIIPVSKDINITDAEINRFELNINNLQGLQSAFKNVSISDSLTLIIAAALKLNASDVHVETEESKISVRFRIDGILYDAAALPKDQWKQFISRVKLLAALKINVTDRPQDGRVTIQLAKDSLDVRISTMPTVYGESVVMRILHSGTKGVTFDELGLRGDVYARLKREVERPNGMIITTGPTGSGKTTTLYAILRTLNKPGVKIITLEDPIEIKMEGLNQSQVDPSRDYTFAKGLRSLLRQDPDICMVGEIRDLETADIAIQAALTGHLMLSTIHTNSASGAIPRLLSMGVKPFLLAPSLNSIIGQRLVRRACPFCMEEEVIAPEKMERVLKLLETLPPAEAKNVDLKNLHFYHSKGCDKCSGLGYRGRVGIYEIFIMNKEIERVILSEQISEFAIQDLAIKDGMVTMAQDGILKALDKLTTVDEVFRVT